jgi:inorganic pyrophosphatase
MIKIFIETEAGSRAKRRYDDETLALKESFEVPLPYPYAYGFVLGTKTGDGGGIDCYVLGAERVASGSIVECEALGLIEMHEDDELDDKLVARLAGASPTLGELPGGGLDPAIPERIEAFILELFMKFPEVKIEFGRVLDAKEALARILAAE